PRLQLLPRCPMPVAPAQPARPAWSRWGTLSILAVVTSLNQLWTSWLAIHAFDLHVSTTVVPSFRVLWEGTGKIIFLPVLVMPTGRTRAAAQLTATCRMSTRRLRMLAREAGCALLSPAPHWRQ